MQRTSLAKFTVLIALIAVTAAAESQSRDKVTVEASVPFEFAAGNRALPAGNYVFEMATGVPKLCDETGVLIIRNRERGLYVAIAAEVTANQHAPAAPQLVFVRDGERMLLSKVQRQDNAAGLHLRTTADTTEAEDWPASRILTLEPALEGSR